MLCVLLLIRGLSNPNLASAILIGFSTTLKLYSTLCSNLIELFNFYLIFFLNLNFLFFRLNFTILINLVNHVQLLSSKIKTITHDTISLRLDRNILYIFSH